MPMPLETSNDTARDDRLYVAPKAEIIAALQHEGHEGLALEWVLDRCDTREGPT